MNKSYKLLWIFVCLFIGVLILCFLINSVTTDESFNGFSGEVNDTVIICSATGDMKALEVGVASYAGKEGIPLILTSQTIPFPLNEWFSLFKDRANIKKVILIGPVSSWQVLSLKLLNLNVERIDGSSKAEILTEMAEKAYKSQDTVIITSSDPSASLLGAYMDVPVFVVAEPGEYVSSDTLEPEYESYISDNNIKRVIVVGTVSQGIIDNLNSKDIQLEKIGGDDNFQTSVLVSDRIRDILGQRSVEVKTAYAGFYGELPSIIPLAVRNNSIILTDPTIHMDEALDYLTTVGIDDVVITRNGPADYLQMEEPDFVSSRFIDRLHAAGIDTSSLTNFRTINEATGLYETKMMAAEVLHGTGLLWGDKGLDPSLTLLDSVRTVTTDYPPILDTVLKGGNWGSSTGSQLTVKQIGLNEWYYQWKGIHPYIWQKINDDDWYCYSGIQYSWHWIHANKTEHGILTDSTNDTWTVEYLSDNQVYNRVYWVKKGNIWEEIHSEASFNWKKELNSWICYQNGVNGSFTLFPHCVD
jgi:putative cell wall-binding protein